MSKHPESLVQVVKLGEEFQISPDLTDVRNPFNDYEQLVRPTELSFRRFRRARIEIRKIADLNTSLGEKVVLPIGNFSIRYTERAGRLVPDMNTVPLKIALIIPDLEIGDIDRVRARIRYGDNGIYDGRPDYDDTEFDIGNTASLCFWDWTKTPDIESLSETFFKQKPDLFKQLWFKCWTE